MLIRSVLLAALVLATVRPAHAHLGHLGEVAGHSHWIGLGAIVVAGVIAAALGKGAKVAEDGKETEDATDDTETDSQGEAA